MANLDFVEQHNMVACLEKTEGNKDFHEIFWNTASSQTVNDEKQIHATVDSKAVVVTKASIRSSLLFNDVDGTPCLTNEAIFQNLALMGYEEDQPHVTESSSHDTTQDIRDSLEGTNGSEEDQVQSAYDSPLSGGHTSTRAEGALNLEELSVFCTNLSNRVLALEFIKDVQAAEILQLKSRIKKLEKKKTAKPKWDDSTLDDLDADHGMEYMETEEPVDEGRLSEETKEVKLTVDTEEMAKDKGSGEKSGSTKELVSTAEPETVSTARPAVSTAKPTVGTAESEVDAARQEDSAVEPRTPPTTTSIFDDEDITMAQTLIKMKEEKAKEKGVTIKDIEDSLRPARSILTLKPLPIIDTKDKGKGVLEEPEPTKKTTKSDVDATQITRDEELARQLEADLKAEVEKERNREEEASKAAIAEIYNEVQVGIDVDALFVAKLQQEEREEYTIKERAKFFTKTIDAQRKFRAAQRSAKIRSRPPTKSQLRNLMMTYMKNMGGYKHSQLKTKSFED
ncbi:hypothetical protein Tco_1426030, partial [Tanacetum coccineum]